MRVSRRKVIVGIVVERSQRRPGSPRSLEFSGSEYTRRAQSETRWSRRCASAVGLRGTTSHSSGALRTARHEFRSTWQTLQPMCWSRAVPIGSAVQCGPPRAIPIIAVDLESDPVASGFVKTLARPGGNVTGIWMDLPEIAGKQVQFLREVLPSPQPPRRRLGRSDRGNRSSPNCNPSSRTGNVNSAPSGVAPDDRGR